MFRLDSLDMLQIFRDTGFINGIQIDCLNGDLFLACVYRLKRQAVCDFC